MPRKLSIHPGVLAPLLFACGAAALAASDHAVSNGALKPRYAIEAARVQASSSHPSSDARFTLGARLQRADSPQTGSGIALKATLVADATDAACDASGTIFADSFE